VFVGLLVAIAPIPQRAIIGGFVICGCGKTRLHTSYTPTPFNLSHTVDFKGGFEAFIEFSGNMFFCKIATSIGYVKIWRVYPDKIL
jgi:hypothetical protein